MQPKKLGRYEILEEIGRGAMGIVYLAFDPQIKRKIAVKVFKLEHLADPEEQKKFKVRFQREAQLAGNLSHPNIIAIHDVGEEEGLSFIAMELVEGESLAKKMAELYPFSINEIADIFNQICSGMEYAHQQGIIHRDLKPSNILIRKDGLIKIADFGIARALGATITESRKTLGTPAYMSPEQITGRRIDKRSDIFSLGIILYQMLTGERPFAGEITSTVIYRIINEDPIPPRKINIQVPPAFNLIVMKALSKDPAERYQTCQELLKNIKNYQSLKPSKTLPTVPLSEDKSKAAPLPALKKPRRWSWTIIASLLAIIAIASILLYEKKYKEREPEEIAQAPAQLKEGTVEDGSSAKPVNDAEKKDMSVIPEGQKEQKAEKKETLARDDSNMIFAFGPMPPGKYILKIDGKVVQEEAFLSLSFLNLFQKESPKIFFALRKKALELRGIQRYRNIYRKSIPVPAGQHDISLQLILLIPQGRAQIKEGTQPVVRRREIERKISGQFSAGKTRILLLRGLKGDISLQWITQKQYRRTVIQQQ